MHFWFSKHVPNFAVRLYQSIHKSLLNPVLWICFPALTEQSAMWHLKVISMDSNTRTTGKFYICFCFADCVLASKCNVIGLSVGALGNTSQRVKNQVLPLTGPSGSYWSTTFIIYQCIMESIVFVMVFLAICYDDQVGFYNIYLGEFVLSDMITVTNRLIWCIYKAFAFDMGLPHCTFRCCLLLVYGSVGSTLVPWYTTIYCSHLVSDLILLHPVNRGNCVHLRSKKSTEEVTGSHTP